MELRTGNRYCADSMTRYRELRARVVVTAVFASLIYWIFTR